MPPPRDWKDPSTAIYRDPAFESFDSRFDKYNATTTSVWTGGVWTEGPVWFGDQQLLIFGDIPNDRLMAYNVATGHTHVFRQPSNFINGNTRDRQGRLVSCEQGTRRVTRTEYDGSITTSRTCLSPISPTTSVWMRTATSGRPVAGHREHAHAVHRVVCNSRPLESLPSSPTS
jgi:hypothetical protein